MSSINAVAAAVASRPGIKNGIYLNALDARIVQYHYGIAKLKRLMGAISRAIKASLEGNKESGVVPLASYILLFGGPIFNISDLIFKRYEILQNGRKFNYQQPIRPQLSTNSINFDLFENLTNYENSNLKNSLPDLNKNIETLKYFEKLSQNTLEIYENRLKQAIIERTASRWPNKEGDPIPFNTSKIDDLIDPIELENIESLFFKQELKTQDFLKNNKLKTETQIKNDLFKTDLSIIKIITTSIDKCLNQLLNTFKHLENCKNISQIMELKNWEYSVHRGFAILLKLADLYCITRKLGKKIYFQDYHLLKSSSQYHRNILLLLKNLDIFFNQPKRNNLLLASIIKLTRQGSNFQVRPDVLVQLGKDARNGYQIVYDSNSILKEFYVVCSSCFSSEFENTPNIIGKSNKETSPNKIKNHSIEKLPPLKDNENNSTILNQAIKDEEIDSGKKITSRNDSQDADTNNDKIVSNSSKKISNPVPQSSASATMNHSNDNSQQRHSLIIPSQFSPELKRHSNNDTHNLENSNLLLSSNKVRTIDSLSGSKANSSSSSLRSSTPSLSTVDSADSNTTSSTPPIRNSSPSKKLNNGLRRSSSLQYSSTSNKLNNNNRIIAAAAGAAFTNDPNQRQASRSNSLQSMQYVAKQRIQQQDKLRQAHYQNRSRPASEIQPASPPKHLNAQERLYQHILAQSKNGSITIKSVTDKPTVSYRPRNVTGNAESRSGSRSNSLKMSSYQQKAALSHSSNNQNRSSPNSSSRSSSLQNISESEVLPLRSTIKEKDQITDKLMAQDKPNISNEMKNNAVDGKVSINKNNEVSRNSPVSTETETKTKTETKTETEADDDSSKLLVTEITKSDEDSTSDNFKTAACELEASEAFVETNRVNTSDRTLTSTINGDVICDEEDESKSEVCDPPQVIKRVRFIGVPAYNSAEDAPSPARALKNFRKAFLKPAYGTNLEVKRKDRHLINQEGMAFKAFKQKAKTGDWEGFASLSPSNNQIPTLRSGTLPSLSSSSSPGKRISKLFKNR
ncbi:hypothetical protein PACTADRAFT_3027 [Pachysolen tannophilus NRRL Y-2460]|uniref:Uncharacterized protein n=1 Tax=Pachysolen tannophilus NRRL Y-2460 TaxID=669874 RepID=A0A1E4TU85_PACTA|nr:hypothetical protein PACTADRAFT_3027 [Pachysolen tannophilus NRRL Y-2460]